MSHSSSDPVTDLPADLAALCLSFVDIPSLLRAEQVSHSWQRAINGGLPAVWHHACLKTQLQVNMQLALVASKSRGRVQSLKVESAVSAQGLRPFVNLLVLDICMFDDSICPVLSCFPLLEELCITGSDGVVFPPLQHLKAARCGFCHTVKGLSNLPALTKLDLQNCSVDVRDAWPASLRDVTILRHFDFQPQLVDRIAALRQPIRLATDWSFANNSKGSFFVQPYNQLSFLSGFTTLQVLTIKLSYTLPPQIVFNCLGAIASLRELTLEYMEIQDQDMQCLSHLTSLQRLTLSCITSLTSEGLRHLSSIPNLTKLSVKACRSVADYTPLGTCWQLRELEIERKGQTLAASEVQAISQLKHAEKLVLNIPLQSAESFAHICAMANLRELDLAYGSTPIPAHTLASLPALQYLERLYVAVCQAEADKVVNCLVQIPKLRHVCIWCELSVHDRARLRTALPRLETLLPA